MVGLYPSGLLIVETLLQLRKNVYGQVISQSSACSINCRLNLKLKHIYWDKNFILNHHIPCIRSTPTRSVNTAGTLCPTVTLSQLLQSDIRTGLTVSGLLKSLAMSLKGQCWFNFRCPRSAGASLPLSQKSLLLILAL